VPSVCCAACGRCLLSVAERLLLLTCYSPATSSLGELYAWRATLLRPNLARQRGFGAGARRIYKDGWKFMPQYAVFLLSSASACCGLVAGSLALCRAGSVRRRLCVWRACLLCRLAFTSSSFLLPAALRHFIVPIPLSAGEERGAVTAGALLLPEDAFASDTLYFSRLPGWRDAVPAAAGMPVSSGCLLFCCLASWRPIACLAFPSFVGAPEPAPVRRSSAMPLILPLLLFHRAYRHLLMRIAVERTGMQLAFSWNGITTISPSGRNPLLPV